VKYREDKARTHSEGQIEIVSPHCQYVWFVSYKYHVVGMISENAKSWLSKAWLCRVGPSFRNLLRVSATEHLGTQSPWHRNFSSVLARNRAACWNMQSDSWFYRKITIL
jgi:hypothetical protein